MKTRKVAVVQVFEVPVSVSKTEIEESFQQCDYYVEDQYLELVNSDVIDLED